VETTSVWGTLTSGRLLSHTLGSDCWCHLSAANNQRIVLSIISFEFGSDQACKTSGLFLQSTHNRSDECTQLQKGHYYISSSQDLFVNFYVKPEIARGVNEPQSGSFWIVYEGKI